MQLRIKNPLCSEWVGSSSYSRAIRDVRAPLIPWLVVTCLVPVVATAQAPARDGGAAPPAGSASIRGRVVDAASGQPLSRVEIRVGPNRGPVPDGRSALTDGDGRYNIGGLSAGGYAVTAEKPNYLRTAWGATREGSRGTVVTVGDGQTIDHVDLMLRRAGVIVGRILDEFGDPAVGVQVVPMQYRYGQDGRLLRPSGRTAATNDVGEFRVYGLTPGQYYVSATMPWDRTGAITQTSSEYAPSFYPGTSRMAEALRVSIAPGQTVTGVNFTLVPAGTSRVAGTVTDSSGAPVTRSSVNVMERRGLTPGGVFTQTGADGTFMLRGLTSGDYILRVFAGDRESAAATLTADGSDILDLRLTTAKPSKVSGHVTFERGGTPPLPAASTLRVTAMQPDATGNGDTVPVRDDLTFEMNLSAGRTFVRASPTRDWRLNRVVVDGVDVTDTGLDVPLNGSLSKVIVELTSHLNPVTGRVTDAAGAGVGDCVVIVFAKDPVHWTSASPYTVNFRPGGEGRFRVKMPPGDYYAAALTELEAGAANDPDFLARLRDDAVSFSVRDGVDAIVDVKVSPTPTY